MNKKRTVRSLFLVAILFLSVVLVPMGNAKIDTIEKEEKQNEAIGTPWFETGDELKRLSTDELHELAESNATIKMIIEEDLKLSGVKIESLADLQNMPDDYPLDIKMEAVDELISASQVTTLSTNTVYVWIVADEEYRSYFGSNWQSEAYETIEAADESFGRDHNINFVVGKYSTWDSNDNVHDSSLLDEAQSETGWNSDQDGMDMLAVFTNQATDKRGWAESINDDGGDAWIMKHQTSLEPDWDWHVAQHEASHNYGCPDHGYYGPYCAMTYTFMMGADEWCSSCDSTIETNRNHF